MANDAIVFAVARITVANFVNDVDHDPNEDHVVEADNPIKGEEVVPLANEDNVLVKEAEESLIASSLAEEDEG